MVSFKNIAAAVACHKKWRNGKEREKLVTRYYDMEQ